MADHDADYVIRRLGELQADRANWDSHCSQVARRVLPRLDDFTGQKADGARRTEWQYDSTAPLALQKYAAAIEGFLTPRAQRWHGLKATDDSLNEMQVVREYFQAATKVLFDVRYNTYANFSAQLGEVLLGHGAFGTSAMLLEDEVGKGLLYRSIAMASLWIAENKHGRVDVGYRKFRYTARQCAQRFGLAALPPAIRAAHDKNDWSTKWEIIHAVEPNTEMKPGARDWRGKPVVGRYVALEGRQTLAVEGFTSMPLLVARNVTGSSEVYGRSVAMMVLPSIKMVNEMNRTVIRASHRQVDPPIMTAMDGVMGKLNMRPGAVNVGGISPTGEYLARPFETNAQLGWAEYVLSNEREAIQDAFLVNLFQVLVDNPRMTATEVLSKTQERGILLSPTMGRLETELLGPLIERELALLAAAGQLPPMPDVLKEAQGEYTIVYDNPYTQAQRAPEALALTRAFEAAAPLIQLKPDVLDNIDEDKAFRLLHDAFGAPANVMRDVDAVAAIREGRAQQADIQQAVAAAPMIGRAAKDMAQAEAASA